LGNLRRIAVHFFGELPERIHLRPRDVFAITARCGTCHAQEYREWTAGGHRATYAAIFTRPGHNHARPLMDDCLRCHGMHQPGDIASVVTPVSANGPWTLSGAPADAPAIPCLTCHAMHVDASNAKGGFFRQAASDEATPTQAHPGKVRPSLAIYDRRTQQHVSARYLPIPAMRQGSTAVQVTATAQNALCYQCHAPYANLQVGTNDDKTPLGAYEGMACLDCHQRHTLKSKYDCSAFHRHPESCLDRIPPTAVRASHAHESRR
jgi:hypothetical protein